MLPLCFPTVWIYAEPYTSTTDDLRNSLREAYVGLIPADGWYVDVGRINDKEGVATGFNPTDFFKSQAVLVQQNTDPATLRDVRLGVVMARLQRVWDGGAVAMMAAPALVEADGPLRAQVFNPGLDRTNRDNRFLAKGSLRLADDLAPELLVYQDGGRSPVLGGNVTHGFGDRVVAWGEWSSGRRGDVIADALAEGKRTGLFPAAMTAPLAHDGGDALRSQSAMGASLTFDTKLTLTAEWHYNQQGLSESQWHAWFSQRAAISSALWQIRSYAQSADDPISRNQLFLRADWPDFAVKDLELSGFVVNNPADGSLYVQAEADYYLNPRTTLGLRAADAVGTSHSEWGSVPQALSLTARLVRYF